MKKPSPPSRKVAIRRKKRRTLSPEIARELKALKAAARDARKLSIITGTPFWVMKNGKLVNLNKGRKQTAAQREIIRLMRPIYGY